VTQPARIASLHVYPLKSARGIDLTTARLDPRGLRHDRRWMVVDGRGRFVTQRTLPALARVRTQLGDDSLTLSAPGHAPFTLPVSGRAVGARVPVEVWSHRLMAEDCGKPAADWISAMLGEPLRIVRACDDVWREPDGEFRGITPAPVSFPDAYPLLVCNTASLAELNRRMGSDGPVPMDRFRPNVVIDGWESFVEDQYTGIAIDDVRLRLVKACARCSTTTIDQQSGAASANPLPALRRFRFDRALRGVTFGQNAVIVAGIGHALSVGSQVKENHG